MAVQCYVTLNANVLYPALPVERYQVLVREQKRMLNGQMRTAHRAAKYGFVLTFPDATEAERATWIAAAAVTASVTFVDELNVSRTVVVQDVRDDLVRTAPAVDNGSSTTGPGYYDLTVTLEEV